MFNIDNGPILSPFKNLITVLASTTSCGNEFHNLIMDVIWQNTSFVYFKVASWNLHWVLCRCCIVRNNELLSSFLICDKKASYSSSKQLQLAGFSSGSQRTAHTEKIYKCKKTLLVRKSQYPEGGRENDSSYLFTVFCFVFHVYSGGLAFNHLHKWILKYWALGMY